MLEPGRLRRRNRWLAAGLVLSLALNAFIIGAVATDLVRVKWRSGDRDLRAFRFELRWLEHRLTPEAVDQVEAGITKAEPEVAAHFDRLRDLRTELGVLAAAPEPDRRAIDEKLAAIREEVTALQTEVQTTTMDALLGLPPDARAPLAEPRHRR